jgi:hypothetical protein
MGLTRSSFVRAMVFQSTTKFLPDSRWFLGSLEFLTDKFGNLSLQELELNKVTGSGTDRLPLDPFQVSLVNKTQPRHELGTLGKKDTYPAKVKADHTLADQIAATDMICSPVSVSDSKYSSEVYMVEQGGEPLKKLPKRSNGRPRKRYPVLSV